MEKEMKKIMITLSALSLLALSGCSTTKDVNQNNKDLITNEEYREILLKEERKLNNRLAKSALLAAESQKIISETNNGLARPMYDYDKIREARFQATYVPVGMERILPIDWDGPIEPVLETLVHYAGYELAYKGTKPIQSKDVTLMPGPVTIKQHIDNIDINAKGYIKDIFIDEPDKKVIVVYENF